MKERLEMQKASNTTDTLIQDYAYTSQEVYMEKFLKWPCFLDTNPKYSKMKESSKKVYMYLKDRNNYSLKHNLVDENNKLFLIFTIDELVTKALLSRPTIMASLRELEEYELIVKRKNGFNKGKRQNYPNFYYLLKPILVESDVFENQIVKNFDPHSNQRFFEGKNFLPSSVSTFVSDSENQSDGKNSLLNLYKTINKDNKDYKGSNEIFNNSLNSTDIELEEELIRTFIQDNNLNELWGDNIINCILLVSQKNYKVFLDWYKKFYYAIQSAENDSSSNLKYHYSLCTNFDFVDHVRDELALTLRDTIRRIKTDHKIRDSAKYFFMSIKNTTLRLLEQQSDGEV